MSWRVQEVDTASDSVGPADFVSLAANFSDGRIKTELWLATGLERGDGGRDFHKILGVTYDAAGGDEIRFVFQAIQSDGIRPIRREQKQRSFERMAENISTPRCSRTQRQHKAKAFKTSTTTHDRISQLVALSLRTSAGSWR